MTDLSFVNKITDVLCAVAEDGAELCLKSFGHVGGVDHKDSDEIVSDLDMKISSMLKERLEPAGFFTYGNNLLVDEETVPQPSPEDIADSDYVVIVDPVDGSGAAIEGRAEYCVMLGLFKTNVFGVLQPVASVVARPKERELLVTSPEHDIELTVNKDTNLEVTYYTVEEACNPYPPRNMLLDYRFGKMFTWSESPKAHLNPSGANMCDMALHRGLGFVFVYKPWDLIPMGLCYATGVKSYFLGVNSDGTYTPTEVTALDMNMFDYDADKGEYGKIKQPLLFCKPDNLDSILADLRSLMKPAKPHS